MMKRSLISLLFILALATYSYAEDIYVAQTSAGGDTGADCDNAHSAAWFNTAGNWGVDAGDITAGDTVHLCGTITTALTVQGSGSEGNVITIVFETGAKISLSSCGTGCLHTNSQTYLTIDGGTNGIIEATSMGTGQTQSQSIGIEALGCANCEIKNLHIHDMYVRNDNADVSGVDATTYPAIRFSGSNILIHDNTIHDVGWALRNLYTSGDDNVRVYNNDISNCGHAYALAAQGGVTTSGSFYYYNNYVHDFANWDSAGCTVAHSSAIHAYGIGGSKITGTLWIYNNRFIGTGSCMTANIFLEGGSDAWTDTTGTTKIFNNLITASGYVTGLVQPNVGTGHEVYNNTIIGDGGAETICLIVGGTTTNAKVKNNYIGSCGHLIHAYAAATIDEGLELDYNVYSNCSSYNCFWVGATDTGSFSTYRTALPAYDANSVDSTGADGGINQTTGVPSAGAVTIGEGVNLSSLGYTALNSDRLGVARGAAWDIGAYEYQAASTPVPTNSGTVQGAGMTIQQ